LYLNPLVEEPPLEGNDIETSGYVLPKSTIKFYIFQLFFPIKVPNLLIFYLSKLNFDNNAFNS